MKSREVLNTDLLISALTYDTPAFPTAEIIGWLNSRKQSTFTNVEIKDLHKLRDWCYEAETGHIIHKSRRFFRVEGLDVITNTGLTHSWQQPIINQPEIGILGLVARYINGILHFCVQAKIEPGNINCVQLSPTLQATKSNYTRAHGGKEPLYLEYFSGNISSKVIYDQLQSEQGSRFLRKRNRNIIVLLDEKDSFFRSNEDFVWLTLGQIKQLSRKDNVINMDTRSIISSITFCNASSDYKLSCSDPSAYGSSGSRFLDSAFETSFQYNSMPSILSWIAGLKMCTTLRTSPMPLGSLSNWSYKDGSITHDLSSHFSVIGVSVQIDSREAVEWDQPMFKPSNEGLIAFIVRPIDGILHFLVQAKLEAGNLDLIELAPTVQTQLIDNGSPSTRPLYVDQVLQAGPDQILLDSLQSEEGGRFFREQNRNLIVEVDSAFPLDVDPYYCWLTLSQLLRLCQYSNYVNISARSILASIRYS